MIEVISLSCLTFSRKQTSPKTTSAQISNLSSWRTKCSNWCDSLTCWEEKECLYCINLIHSKKWFAKFASILNLFSHFPLLIGDDIHTLPSVYVNLYHAYDCRRPYWAVTILVAQFILGSTGLLLHEMFYTFQDAILIVNICKSSVLHFLSFSVLVENGCRVWKEERGGCTDLYRENDHNSSGQQDGQRQTGFLEQFP